MRDRLIELLLQSRSEHEFRTDIEVSTAYIADDLLQSGVFVPPCKVGDTVYVHWSYGKLKGIAPLEVTRIVIEKEKAYIATNIGAEGKELFKKAFGRTKESFGVRYAFEDFGKTVFRYEIDAREALERSKE